MDPDYQRPRRGSVSAPAGAAEGVQGALDTAARATKAVVFEGVSAVDGIATKTKEVADPALDGVLSGGKALFDATGLTAVAGAAVDATTAAAGAAVDVTTAAAGVASDTLQVVPGGAGVVAAAGAVAGGVRDVFGGQKSQLTRAGTFDG